ncbi:Spy/CpxP family protein refolding chaperone [Baaleninema sp.]|uniref:Spy/CpxP family protein refolding chaperone n=1 Tax=Baaleninema sp. TaxID=3101197 RepID=UPI003CFC6B3B
MNHTVKLLGISTIALFLLSAVPLRTLARPASRLASLKQVQSLDTQTLFAQVVEMPLFAGINISPQQEAMLRPILEQTRARMDRILSLEQQNRFHRMMMDGQPLDRAVEAMELTEEQKTQLDRVLQMTGLQVAPIFTPEQRERLEANIEAAQL